MCTDMISVVTLKEENELLSANLWNNKAESSGFWAGNGEAIVSNTHF